MAKVLQATCENGQVTCQGQEIDATILSEGVGSSSGIVVIDEYNVYYVATTSPDLETTLTKTISAIQKIATTLTAIGAGMTGPTTAPPPTLAADVTEINGYATDLETLKGELK